MLIPNLYFRRFLLTANILGDRASGAEPAAGRQVSHRRRLPFDRVKPVIFLPVKAGHGVDQGGGIRMPGRFE